MVCTSFPVTTRFNLNAYYAYIEPMIYQSRFYEPYYMSILVGVDLTANPVVSWSSPSPFLFVMYFE
jgi:hypothetical protein